MESLALALELGEQSQDFTIPYHKCLEERLFHSGSIWELTTAQQMDSLSEADKEELVAVHINGKVYVSIKKLGPSEIFLGRWVREKTLSRVKVDRIISNGLTEHQRNAVFLCCNSEISILTGGPGTGKTTTARCIYETLCTSGLTVALCAFIGSAASRLGETVGGESSTIHSLLECRAGTFNRNEDNPLDNLDAIIVDELSTTGSVLLMNLAKALPHGCRIILIGDPEQMSSVDPGNVLKELIRSEQVPHAHLSEVIRTEPDGPIGLASIAILNGKLPQSATKGENGYFFMPCNDDHIIERAFLYQERLAVRLGTDFSNVRTMTATNEICSQYNEYCLSRNIGLIPVVCRRNNKHYGVFNGDFGILNGNGYMFTKKWGDIEVPLSDFSCKICSAFCCTVNVMQGNECVGGQILMPVRGSGFPNRSQFYTAVTRCKKFCVTVGSIKIIERAIRTKSNDNRLSLLGAFIKGQVTIVNDL